MISYACSATQTTATSVSAISAGATTATGQKGRRPTPGRNTNRAKQMEEERDSARVSCLGVRPPYASLRGASGHCPHGTQGG
jgi:hypothetical protein